MDLQKSFTIIAITVLITTLTMTSFATDDAGKNDAEKDKGETRLSRVPGCTLTIVNPDVTLYSNRSLQGIPIAKVPVGNYQPLDYKPGWYKIRAQGWIAWIKDPTTAGVNKSAIQKSNCPDKNTR
jgi:hypothetical protein